MIIDSHAHIFSPLSGFGSDGELKPLSNGKAIWSTGEVIQLLPSSYKKTDFPQDELIKLMDKNNIDKAVLLQGGFLGFDNIGISNAVKQYPNRLSGALTIDPFCRNQEKILNHLLTLGLNAFKFEVSTGCGLMGSHHTFNLDSALMYSIYKKLYGKIKTIAFDLGSSGDESHQVSKIKKIAEDFPDFNIVVCHLSSPRRNQHDNLKKELNLLCKDNIYFDTSALFWKTRPEEYPFPTAREYLKIAKDIVGVEHLMWGSDIPSTLVQVSVNDQINYANDLFTNSEKEYYFYKTAEKVYFKS